MGVFNGCLLNTPIVGEKNGRLIGSEVCINTVSLLSPGRFYMFLWILIEYGAISETHLVKFLELLSWRVWVIIGCLC